MSANTILQGHKDDSRIVLSLRFIASSNSVAENYVVVNV